MISFARIYIFRFSVTILIVFSLGCEDQMKKPMKDMISPPDPPTQTHIQKARDAMERVNQRRTASLQKAEAAGDYLIVFTDSELILKEELGFRKAFWVELVDIYKDENSEKTSVTDGFTALEGRFAERLAEDTLGMFYFEYIRTFDPLIIEYLRLSYVYPAEDEAALLTRFRKSINDGKVLVIFPENF
ncbi:hypothetical protein JT359_13365 [Candidatus Poribacteria bacterium]|nr:hypothetical protein [Candidatus Poribacteria bacterium]